MRIVGYTYTAPDITPAKVRYFYDTSMRLWIVTVHNAAGDQLGDADFPYGASYARQRARQMAAEAGLPASAIERD